MPFRLTQLVTAACTFVVLATADKVAFGQSLTPEVAQDLYAQSAPIEQSRLFERPTGPQTAKMTADGTPLPDSGSSDDDSFGAQQILKTEEKPKEFSIFGAAAGFFTTNAALTHRAEISDSLFVASGGISWDHPLDKDLHLQIGTGASIFRYGDTTALDFENIGAGLGLSWTPQGFYGINFFLRYDFAELLDTGSHEILQDHEFSLGAQKIIPISRAQTVTVGVVGTVGISDPFAAQRDTINAFAGYHVALSRQFDAEVLYRAAGNFYNGGGRNDFNQVVSLGLHYHLTDWAEINGLLSWGLNRSSTSAFDYNVLNTGGGLGLTVHF